MLLKEVLGKRSFGTQHTVTLSNGLQRNVVLSQRSRNSRDQLVFVAVSKFDKAFAEDKGFYVSPQGGGAAIGGRYEEFMRWLEQNPGVFIEAPEVSVDTNGDIGFTNGRHRYAVLRDMGARWIPVAMDRDSVENAKAYGLI